MKRYRLDGWGHDLRLGARLVFWSFVPRVYWTRMSFEVAVGPWTFVHWRGGERRWRIGQ